MANGGISASGGLASGSSAGSSKKLKEELVTGHLKK